MSILNYKSLCRVIVFCVATAVLTEVVSASESFDTLKGFVESIWGKVIIYAALLVATAVFFYIKLQAKFSEARAANDLRFMAKHSAIFEWGHVKARVGDCFYRYHAPWRVGDLDKENVWMADSYWRDFKKLFLDRIEKEGLVNVCNIKTIKEIKPLLFIHRNVGGKDERSKLVVCISAKLRNYLSALATGNLVEGSKEYHDTKTIWSFEVVNGNWVITNIEDMSVSSEYLKLVSDLPKIEDTLLKPVKIMTAAE
ncbi:MAG: hypothetical protein ACRBBN_02285 [Methyloligellaceae bacterium]